MKIYLMLSHVQFNTNFWELGIWMGHVYIAVICFLC